VAGKRGRQAALTRRQKMLVNEVLIPIVLIVLVLAIASAVSYVIVEPIFHPNLHPRLVKFGTYMVHFHPRLCHYTPFAAVSLFVLLHLSRFLAPIYWQIRMRKKGLIAPSDLKSSRYLNQGMVQTIPVLLPEAWQTLKSQFPGMLIRVPCMRDTHWEVLNYDERRRELRLVLQYVHTPLGIKSWRLYPRRLFCNARLTGKGMRTEAELTYTADSAMDYQTVYGIIDQTNGCLHAAMKGRPAVECYSH
jgi:hypothetical protein